MGFSLFQWHEKYLQRMRPSVAFTALMRRNMLYRKRNWLNTLLELLLPTVFVIMLVLVKNSYEETIQAGVKVPGSDLILKPGDAFVPQPEHAYQPLTFRDTVTALRARKVCKWKETNETDGGHFEITGIDRRSKNWQIPYLRCDSRKCTQVGQEASSFCEVSVLALAGKNREGAVRAAAFRDWVLQRYPALVASNATMILRYFDYLDESESSSSSNFYYSNKAIDDYVSSLDYGTTPDRPKISMAIVFDGNDPDAFLYALRPNSTNYNIPENEGDVDGVSRTMPNTNYLIDSRASSDFETCVATKVSNSIRERDLGALGKSCTGQYLYNGVLAAQRLVQDYALALSGAADAGYSVAEAGVQFVQFPMASYNPPGFFVENIITPVLLSLGLLLSVASMIAYIVQEKELRQKELLKMMSVTEVEIEWSWFLTFMLHNLIAATLCTLVSSFLFPNSSIGWLWIFWTLTFLSLTWFCTALAACCTQATRGVFFGLLCFFGGLLPSIVFFISTSPPWLIFIIMLHPVATFSYGISMIGGLEDLTLGVTTQSVPYVHELLGYSFQKILLQFIYSCILWSFLTWYWNRTARLEFGQAPLPRNFPLTKAYWRSVFWPQAHALELAKGAAESTASSTIASSVSSYSDDHDASEKSRIPMEPVPDALRKQSQMGESIEIRNLHKSFGDKVAVNGLNLSLYNGQITALLGHNGAGKTTTINLLTGAVAPTSGTALVAGKDIRTQMGEIRRDIGICMQHDCLFPRLTVREHVEFYSRLKGLYEEMEKDEADKLVDQSIEDVALWDKRDTFSSNLSGGMKRKLSLAIAFCGGSKVVVLDEPTSGMDPFSRRFTWNVIRHYRQNRIIILTTHFMDEADILGDRIAIMSEGKLSCVGSSLFLKKAFGFGYQLTIEKNQVVGHPPHGGVSQEVVQLENGSKVIAQSASGSIEVSNEQLVNSVARPRTDTGDSFTRANRAVYACTKDLKKIITHYIPEAKLLSDVGSELSYQLPLGSSSQFTAMFEKLDEHVDKKSISCYGVSITTLDEVFLMVTRGDRPKKTAFASSRLGSSEMSTTFESANFDQSSLSGLVLDEKITFMRHLKTLLKKRAAIFKRDRRAWIFTTIVPSCFVLVGFFLVKFVTKDPALVPLTLRLADLNPNVPAGLVQNPIPVNSPESPFMCQAPTCSHRTPFIREELTNETYFFCGFQAKLGISYSGYSPTNNTCVVSEPLNIVDTLTDGGAVSEEAVVSNVAQASESLISTAAQYSGSRYGAVWFSHEPDSIMDDGTSYADTVISQCEQVSAQVNYSQVDDCKYFGGMGYIIQYNFTALHAAPLYQALADEALVRHATGSQNFTIEATIDPLPKTMQEHAVGIIEGAIPSDFAAWFLVVLSFPFISGAFATFIVTERYSKAKHMQSVAGVEPSAYWLSSFIWDIANYQIPFLITIVLMFAFNVEHLTTKKRDVLSGVLTVLALYGPASAGFTYCVTFGYQSASLCCIVVIISGFFIGMGGPLTCFVLYLRSIDPRGPQPQLAGVADVIAWFLRWNPFFCLGKGLFNAIYIDTYILILKNPEINAWDPDILATEVYCLAAQSVLYIILAIQMDKWSTNPHILSLWQNFKSLSWVWRMNKPLPIIPQPLSMDDDVLAEQELVLSGKVSDDSILIQKLTKVYDNGKVAVNNLSLGVAPGECFGLLGINGAGKTTTMSILTAEFPPTSGDAILGGYSVTHEPQNIRRQIGYCPQFCAHFENMTGREHLEMYAAIKGVPENRVDEIVSKKLEQVGLSDYDSDRLSTHYSGGMKRRLSLACATIGQPRIIFLDECSTGVDPVACRDIWQLVSDMVVGNGIPSEQPAVILTTHSMEECEALCPRIGIMADGQLQCLGSAQHLKSKFGKGFQLEVKVRHVDRDDTDFVHCMDQLVKRYQGSKVPTTTDEDKDNFDIEDSRMDLSTETPAQRYFSIDEAKGAVNEISGDDSISNMIDVNDPIGFSIWKEATSSPMGGIDIMTLATFVTCEIRMRRLEAFIDQTFPKNILRERQDLKARYELDCEGSKISNIFSSIEQHRDELHLEDYSVSQTSLEQVFNMHAAEAERLKVHKGDSQ